MSGATDSGMVKTMGVVMACMTVFALVCVFTARLLGGEPADSNDPLKRDALMQRIQPLAAVRTSADELEAAAGAVTAAAGDAPAKSGEELYNGACAACHTAGVAGAPVFGDDAEWATRREAGLDALVASVINGKGAMPARGGSTYSDEEIHIVTQYTAGFEVEDAAEAPAAAPESTESAEAAPEAEATESAAVVETTEAEPEAATAATEETTADAAGEDTVAAEKVAALVVGEVPEGLTDNIKANVDGICAGCHLAGVAGAPQNGDKVAWQERADKGLAALTSSVINGLNVMPPRGGSALTDEEIPIAIQYLMSK